MYNCVDNGQLQVCQGTMLMLLQTRQTLVFRIRNGDKRRAGKDLITKPTFLNGICTSRNFATKSLSITNKKERKTKRKSHALQSMLVKIYDIQNTFVKYYKYSHSIHAPTNNTKQVEQKTLQICDLPILYEHVGD